VYVTLAGEVFLFRLGLSRNLTIILIAVDCSR
jgi:hypothetical protein